MTEYVPNTWDKAMYKSTAVERGGLCLTTVVCSSA